MGSVTDWFEGTVVLLSFVIGWAISVEARMASMRTRQEHFP